MYTQCPKCATTFAVTAEVLKQASGKVRCGGCENVFNSLLYLSEQKPDTPADDSPFSGALRGTGSMSDEQALQLRKTLDDLAGPDVRLEDTGVEWLLLPEDESDIFGDTHTPVDAELSGDSGAARIDELLDDSPSPIDEILNATPNAIDAEEVFTEGPEPGSDPEPELRFDDDRGLPEPGDEDAGDAAAPNESGESKEPAPDDVEVPETATASDFAFGDAEEWGELLDEPVFGNAADASGDDSGNVWAEESGDESVDESVDESGEEPRHPSFESSADVFAEDGEDIPQLRSPTGDDTALTDDDMIDRELMDAAVRDDAGLASTIGLGSSRSAERFSRDDADSYQGVETIIMEGDTVRTLLEQEAHEAGDAVTFDAPESGFMAAAKRTFQGRLPDIEGTGRRTALFALGGVVLFALLAGQFLHHSRAELATIPQIYDVVDPVYRSLGSPVTPDWNVRGWRFEVTRGTTAPVASVVDESVREADGDSQQDATEEVLTIYSRVGNRTSKALPYPIIVVSLTNRYEETIGSAALEPGEYLAGDVSTRSLVPAGSTFNAIAGIQSPPADATGFKLNVCYRTADGLLRCATNTFR